jgi:hypothetical protein
MTPPVTLSSLLPKGRSKAPPDGQEWQTPPTCIRSCSASAALSCDRRWNDPTERWRVYFTDDDPPDPATYCPDCAKHEFED